MGVFAEMVVAEIISAVVEFLGSLVGIESAVTVGALAAIAILLFYGHELAGLLAKLGRGLRIGVFVVGAVVVVLLAGFWTGVLSLDGSVGQLVDALASILNGVIH